MNHKWVGCKCLNSQGGFTLLEVLIAVFVVSFGLLGLAALQINSLKASYSSYQATVASLISVDVRERLWASLIDPDTFAWQEKATCPTTDPLDGRLSHVLSEARDDWSSELGVKLPELAIDVDISVDDACNYYMVISWRDGQDNVGINQFNYFVSLPGYEFDNSKPN